MSWDPDLKLDLHFSVFAGPVNSVQDPTKKRSRQNKRKCKRIAIQTNAQSLQLMSETS